MVNDTPVTETFFTPDVITAHSGILLSDRQYARILRLARHVTGQHLTALEFGAQHARIAALLEEQHPFLATLDVPARGSAAYNHFTLNAWSVDVCDRYGEMLEISGP